MQHVSMESNCHEKLLSFWTLHLLRHTHTYIYISNVWAYT